MAAETLQDLLREVRERQSALVRDIDEAQRKRDELQGIDARLTVVEDGVDGDLAEARGLWAEVASLEADLADEVAEVERLASELNEALSDAGRFAEELESLATECESHVTTAEAAGQSAADHEAAATHAATEAHSHATEASHLRSQIGFDPKYDSPE